MADLTLMKRIGYMQNDYNMCIENGEMTDELKQEIETFKTEFQLTDNEVFEILRNDVTIAEMTVMLEH